MLPTKATVHKAKSRGRKPSGSYLVNITLGIDLSCVSVDGNTGHLGDRATVPPMLETYVNDNGHSMPEGLYGFFGDDAELALKSQIEYDLKIHGGEKAPIWDVQATLSFQWADPANRPHAATMAWKNPSNLQGAFIRIGRISGETNDILRFYTGDRRAVDRLTLEPWRVDAYAAVLEEVYGPIRALIFDAMMSDGSIQTIVKIYDPTLVEKQELSPLYRFLSSHDPDQPRAYALPDDKWKGWQKGGKQLTTLDLADIKTFISQPKSDKKTREMITHRRLRMLREEGRFRPREKEIKHIAKRRKERQIAYGISNMNAFDQEAPG